MTFQDVLDLTDFTAPHQHDGGGREASGVLRQSPPYPAPLSDLALRAAFQQTVGDTVHLSGLGLHSGIQTDLKILPGDVDTGLVFFRSDLSNGARHIPAKADNVKNTQLCTLLDNGKGGSVSTIEHLMAAFHALGIDNAVIEINGPEVPILDGSSLPFIHAIQAVGLVAAPTRARALAIRDTVFYTSSDHEDADQGDAPWAQLRPNATHQTGLNLTVSIDFAAPCIGHQTASLALSPSAFVAQVSAARTFGFAEQLETLRSQGRALGGSTDTAIVIENGQVKNTDGLRYGNEFARHKLLDAVGDLYIEGLPVLGVFEGHKSGHRVVNGLMRTLMARPDAFEIVEL